MRRDRGFTLIELLMVMLIFGFVLAATSDMFVGIIGGFTQQSKIAETNIEGVIGLEMLRRDVESAGYGLPWMIPSGTTYSEVPGGNATAAAYNDSPSNPPKAIVSGDGVGPYVSGTDYLVIKAINIARNGTCTKWTHLLNDGNVTIWTSTSPGSVDNLNDSEKVIVISPGTPTTNSRALVAPTSFPSAISFGDRSSFVSPTETRIIYGVDPSSNLIMPFNRADYYVSTSNIPGRCAPGTGVLVKAVVNQSTAGNGFSAATTYPLLDCVADMQVSYKLDRNGDGVLSSTSVLNDLSGVNLNAQQIRDQVKEVRVDILAHEGQKDTNYTHNTNPVQVGSPGRSFDFGTSGIPGWQNYRWKVYTLVVKPNNLR